MGKRKGKLIIGKLVTDNGVLVTFTEHLWQVFLWIEESTDYFPTVFFFSPWGEGNEVVKNCEYKILDILIHFIVEEKLLLK